MFCSRSIGRDGVTLVEMMIALIITLMIVFAMVEAFRRIGETTTDGRASIEMLGQIRTARDRFEQDLSRCTIPVAMRNPRVLQPDQYHGYFELIEGPAADSISIGPNVSRYLVRMPHPLYPSVSVLKYNYLTFADPNDTAASMNDRLAGEWRTLFGDLDDIVCMTMRNDDVPFRGRLAVATGGDGLWGTKDDVVHMVESNLAEVVWWLELNDQPEDLNSDGLLTPPADGDGDGFIDAAGEGGYGVWNLGETFTIRRRVLLIRPDLTVNTSPFMTDPPNPADEIKKFLINNDISVHFHFDQTTHTPMGLQANSLGDLTFRWNRIAHNPIDFSLTDTGTAAGNPLGLSTGFFLSPINPSYLPAYENASMRGEDVVLSNVTGFDFRVWDPNVPVCGYTPLDELPEGLVPGDPGYDLATVSASVPAAGYGAFVDLGAVDPTLSAGNLALYNAMDRSSNGYDDNGNGAADPDATEVPLDPQFVGAMNGRAYLPGGNYVYDPWTLRYESDTYNQDGRIDMDAVVDEGDETLPPYPHPLKVLQVRIRMYESDTRQVKQVSQSIEFAR